MLKKMAFLGTTLLVLALMAGAAETERNGDSKKKNEDVEMTITLLANRSTPKLQLRIVNNSDSVFELYPLNDGGGHNSIVFLDPSGKRHAFSSEKPFYVRKSDLVFKPGHIRIYRDTLSNLLIESLNNDLDEVKKLVPGDYRVIWEVAFGKRRFKSHPFKITLTKNYLDWIGGGFPGGAGKGRPESEGGTIDMKIEFVPGGGEKKLRLTIINKSNRTYRLFELNDCTFRNYLSLVAPSGKAYSFNISGDFDPRESYLIFKPGSDRVYEDTLVNFLREIMVGNESVMKTLQEGDYKLVWTVVFGENDENVFKSKPFEFHLTEELIKQLNENAPQVGAQ